MLLPLFCFLLQRFYESHQGATLNCCELSPKVVFFCKAVAVFFQMEACVAVEREIDKVSV